MMQCNVDFADLSITAEVYFAHEERNNELVYFLGWGYMEIILTEWLHLIYLVVTSLDLLQDSWTLVLHIYFKKRQSKCTASVAELKLRAGIPFPVSDISHWLSSCFD